MDENPTKRTNGFTTYDAEVHAVLDCVSPKVEKLYRKLLQRMNIKRGDRLVYPDYEQLMKDTGFAKATLSSAIQEAVHFRLVSVTKRHGKAGTYDNNVYYLSPVEQLPTEAELSDLVQKMNKVKEQEKQDRKAKTEFKKRTESSSNIEPSPVQKMNTNYDEVNYDEVNYDEEKIEDFQTEDKPKEVEDEPISVKEVPFSVEEEKEMPISDKGSPVAEKDTNLVRPCMQKKATVESVALVYNGTRGSSMERFAAVVDEYRNEDIEYLKSLLAFSSIKVEI